MTAPRPAQLPLRRCAALLLTACAICAASSPCAGGESAASAAGPAKASRFTFYGLEPALAGQPRAQAEAALGGALKPEPGMPPRAASAAPQAALAASAASAAPASAAATRCQH